MLNNIPPILSPELLKVLCEMGHGDRICIPDLQALVDASHSDLKEGHGEA